MIKFFRNSRWRSIAKGKLEKYLLYALGEILLVVIGILIALQINSSNEVSKERKLEKEYYSRFKLELEENIRNADDQIEYSSFQIKNCEIVAGVLDSGKEYQDSQTLYLAIEHLSKSYPTQYTNNVWLELLSSGKTSIIQNVAFREKLAFLNSEMLQAIGLQDQFIANNMGYARLTGEVFSIGLTNELDSKMHPRELRDSTPIPDLPNQREIISKLSSIKGLSGFVADIYQTKKVNKYLFNKHRKLMLELVAICDAEHPQS